MTETAQQETYKKYLLINIIISILVIIGIACFLKFDIYEHDDFGQSFFLTNDIKEILLTADHGRYLSWITMKSVVHGLSNLLNIHPQDNVFGNIFRGFVFAVLGYLLSCVFYINKKIKVPNPLIYLSVLALLFYKLPSSMDLLIRYNQHFGYIFNYLFFLLFILIFGYSYISNTKLNVIKASVTSFLAGVSAHFNIISICGMSFIFFINKIFKRNTVIKKDLYVPVISFVIALFCYFLNPNFWEIKADRTPDPNFYSNLLREFVSFSYSYIKCVFINNYFLILLIILVILILLLKKERTSEITKSINLAIFICFGVFFFNASLFICGRSFYDGHSFWVVHKGLKFITTLFLFTSFAILMSQIKLRFYPIIMFVLSGILATSSIGFWKTTYYDSISKRRLMYLIDKTNLFYANKSSGISYLPHNSIIENWIYYDGWYGKNFYLVYNVHLPKKLIFIDKNFYKTQIKNDGLHISPQELVYPVFTNLYKFKN